MIRVKPKYDLSALKANVIRIDANIARLQEGIDKEYETKAHLLVLIKELEEVNNED